MFATGAVQQVLPAGVLFVSGLALFGIWWLLGGAWLASVVANLVRPRGRRGAWWRWAVAPPVMLLLVTGRPGLNLKFWIARPALERLAAKVAPSGAPIPPDQTVWFMRVSDVRPLPGGGMRFATNTGDNPFDYTGLAYCPTPLPQDTAIDTCYFTPYCGNWYTFWRP